MLCEVTLDMKGAIVTIWDFLFCFLFVFSLFIIISSSVPVIHTFCHILALVFPSLVFVFMFDLSPNTARVCVCTIRLFPGFWYLH